MQLAKRMGWSLKNKLIELMIIFFESIVPITQAFPSLIEHAACG
jgi:hypothetical protein